jgi:3-dehydroquinate dehydratase / shikimate dehydrogenase
MVKQALCVTVTGSSMTDLRRRRDAVTDADLVEIRLDSVPDPNAAAALADRRLPVIVTCRPVWEGGSFAGSEEERMRLLEEALVSGAEYVDVEFSAGFGKLLARTGGKRLILSVHDFERIPGDIGTRVQAMQATGVEVVKLGVKTARLADCVTLLEVSARACRRGRLVVIGMGDHGLITRALPSRFHGEWTYAGALASIGQLRADALIREFRFREIDSGTSIYGVVGSPVAHSVSPSMHNAAFRESRIDAVYLPLPAVDVDDFVTFARAFGLKGASITTPYKVALFHRVDATSDLAMRIGAINTLRTDGVRWLGDNSDVSGFLEALRSRSALAGIRAAVLGAGGAARSVSIGLAERGAHVTVHARNAERAQEVAALVSGDIGPWPPGRGSWDLLVNCTPIGMHPHVADSPVPAEQLRRGIVYDLVYNPPMTRLLREADAAGCQTIGGLEMLVGQAQQQFEWWTGVRPPAHTMRAAAIRKLQEFAGAVAQAEVRG